MGLYVRVAPGLKLRATQSGLRVGVGPRAARMWVGAGGSGVSTGAGPVSYYQRLGGGGGRGPSRTSMAAFERQVRQAQQLEELQALATRLQEMTSIRQEEFPTAEPGIAPPPAPVDLRAFKKRHRREALKEISIFRIRDRWAAKRQARESAIQAAAEEEVRRREGQEETQRSLDAAWKKLLSNDPELVIAALEAAFADNDAPAIPIDCQDGRVTTLMVLDGPDAVPERVPHVTPTGRPSSRKLNKTDRNTLYLGWLSSNLLATVREAFAAAPAIAGVTVVVLRHEPMTPFGDHPLAAVYVGTLTREQHDRMVWMAPEALDAIFHAKDLLMNQKDRTKELLPIDLSDLHGLAEVVAEVESTLSANRRPPASDRDHEVILVAPGTRKIAVIKAMRNVTRLGLR